MSIKLIIFDLDGTLVDTSRDITAALNVGLKSIGLPLLSVSETSALVGEGIKRLIEKALSPDMTRHIKSVRREFIDYYSAHLTDYSRPYPHVRETLESLHEIKKAVVSNKIQSLSVRLLEELDLIKYFDPVVGGDTVPEKKPAPAPVRHVLDSLGVEAFQALMVGDSSHDIKAGRAAGLKTIALTSGYGNRRALAGANHLIDNMGGLLPLLYTQGHLAERRLEGRYQVPHPSHNYIEMLIKKEEGELPALVVGFSKSGLMVRTRTPLEPASTFCCVLSAPMSLKRTVGMTIRVKHCRKEDEGYITGTEIESVEDRTLYEVLIGILGFIISKEERTS